MHIPMNRHTPPRALNARAGFLLALPLLLTACPKPKTDAIIRNPATLPPQAKVVTLTCPENQYLRGGQHLWHNNRWNWKDPRCTPKPSNWRDGCVWLRGRWIRQDDRIGYEEGRIRCPGDPDPAPRLRPTPVTAAPRPSARPTSLPPKQPSGAIGCGPGKYLQVGHYIWKDGAWRWLTGRCASRPADWKASCRWHRGRWSKPPSGFAFTRGRLVCP
jgi:hypothetical protein